MATLFDDDFESYSVGASLPLGVFLGSGGNVQNFGDPTGKSYGGFFTLYTLTAPQKVFSAFFSYLTPDAAGTGAALLSLQNVDPSALNTGKTIFGLYIELNSSVTCVAGNGVVMRTLSGTALNSNIVAGLSLEPSKWYFFSLFFDLEEDGTTHNIIVNVDVYIDGNLIMSGSADSGINAFTTYLNAPKINKWTWAATSINGSFIDNLTGADSAGVGGLFPHPSLDADRLARISQAVLEHIDAPTASNARISQAVLETVEYHDPKARISQMVIELITQRVPAVSFIAKPRRTVASVRGTGSRVGAGV